MIINGYTTNLLVNSYPLRAFNKIGVILNNRAGCKSNIFL